MKDAVIVSTARTPIGKAYRGAFNNTHGGDLGAHAVKNAVERAGVDPAEIEDVLMGCAQPEGATGSNIARQIALRAGLPETTAGATVNRFCSSGMQTIAMAAQRVARRHGIPMIYEIRAFWEDAAVGNGTGTEGSPRYWLARQLEGWIRKSPDSIFTPNTTRLATSK